MRRGMMIAFLVLSLGMLATPGLAARGTVSGTMDSAERTVKHAGERATRQVTDSWLTLQTKLALLADERVSSADVHVKTQRGVITLRGKVDSETELQAAGEIAQSIEGAREVSNQLTVVPQGDRRAVDREDREIVRDIKQEFKNDGRVRRARIQVRSDDGIVTLTGRAPSLETRVRASELARRVPGVRAVRNEIRL